MSQYTSLLKKSAALREENEIVGDTEDKLPEIEEVAEVIEEPVEEVIEEPTPSDPLTGLFSELEQVFEEGSKIIEPPKKETARKKKKKVVVEEVESSLQDLFTELQDLFSDDVEEPAPIVEQVVEVNEEVINEEVIEEVVIDNDSMEQYTSLLKSTRKISNDHQGISEEASTPATMQDLKKLANNLQKSLSSLGGGGVGENDVIKIIKQYGGELGGGSGSGETDGGSASSIYLPEQLINGGDANGE